MQLRVQDGMRRISMTDRQAEKAFLYVRIFKVHSTRSVRERRGLISMSNDSACSTALSITLEDLLLSMGSPAGFVCDCITEGCVRRSSQQLPAGSRHCTGTFQNQQTLVSITQICALC